MAQQRKLKKEIKLLESFGKKPKPVEEFILDKRYEANIAERVRPPVEQRNAQIMKKAKLNSLFQLNEDELDERVVVCRDYTRYQNRLAVMDMLWINESIRKQEKALQKLKVPRHYLAFCKSKWT
ncbi:unnamed protein product [Gongylonema pulchrum]|uniref:Uncharacterized protein n=1 Tax=Gongylonema pulchrum TaxID=637853 RepID=A0A183EXR5_9BILA|nr:unnamed protein product [Gongylonema pulchrum]